MVYLLFGKLLKIEFCLGCSSGSALDLFCLLHLLFLFLLLIIIRNLRFFLRSWNTCKYMLATYPQAYRCRCKGPFSRSHKEVIQPDFWNEIDWPCAAQLRTVKDKVHTMWQNKSPSSSTPRWNPNFDSNLSNSSTIQSNSPTLQLWQRMPIVTQVAFRRHFQEIIFLSMFSPTTFELRTHRCACLAEKGLLV